MNIIKSVLLAILVLPVFASAQTTGFEEVSCFDEGLYEFQSVEFNVGPEKTGYSGGDSIRFIGEITNHNEYPVVDGNVFARVSRVNDNYMTEGHNIVDEFIALSNISINASSTKNIEFNWDAPINSMTDDYRIDLFFSVGEKYNLGGLPFTNEILAGFSKFSVQGVDNGVYFDKGQTTVNDETYLHIGEWPQISSEESVVIKQPIVNNTDEDVSVDIAYDLFYWDSLNMDDHIDSKSETVVVPANSQYDATYVIDNNTNPVNYVSFVAEANGVTSIANIRVISDETKVRLNYPAINNFPLSEGDSATVFSCYHMTGGNMEMETVSLHIELEDSAGSVVFEGEYTGDVDGEMRAIASEFVADKEYSYLKLKASLMDASGNLIEEYENEYSCNDIGGEACFNIINDGYIKDIVGNTIIILLSLFAVAFALDRLIKHSELKKNVRILAILIAVLTLITAIISMFNRPEYVEAQNFSDGQAITQSDGDTDNWVWGWEDPNGRKVASGNITHTVIGTLTTDSGETALEIGDTATLTVDDECTHNAYASNWDTPYCNQDDNFSAGGRSGHIDWENKTYHSSHALTSSDESVVTCEGTVCTAVAPGSATLSYYQQYVTWRADGCVDISGGKVCDDSTILAHSRKLRLSNNNSNNTSTFKDTKKSLGSFSFSWDVTVDTGDLCENIEGDQDTIPSGYERNGDGDCYPSLAISCTNDGSPQDVPATVTWTATASGGDDVYTYSWSQSGDEDGVDNTFTKTYSTSGTQNINVTVDSAGLSKTASCSQVYVIDPGAPVDAECGSAESQQYPDPDNPPSSNLCSIGTAGDVTYNSGTDNFEWECLGINGGEPDYCQVGYNGDTFIIPNIKPFPICQNPNQCAVPRCLESECVVKEDEQCGIAWEVYSSEGTVTCGIFVSESDGENTLVPDSETSPVFVNPGNTYYVQCTDDNGTYDSDFLECILNPNFQEI